MAIAKQQPSTVGRATDFTLASSEAKRRLIVSVEGIEKSGKDHFALTAPGDLYVHNFDFGLDGVVQKFQAHKKIYVADYKLHVPAGTAIQDASDTARPVWEKFQDNYRSGIKKGRTSIIDTGTEAYEVLRMAEFGKLQQVMPHHYAPVNQAMKSIYREAYDTETNLIVLHRMKEEWMNKVVNGKEKGEKTGNWIMSGYSGTYFEAQVCCRAFKEEGRFKMLVFDCRFNPDIEGMVLEGDMLNFPTLGQMVFPDSTQSDWE